MNKLTKWGLRLAGGLLGLAVLAVILLFAWSEIIINERYEVSGLELAVPDDPVAIARGEKVAKTRGCLGCHRRDASGGLFVDNWMLAVLPSPNLTRLVHERSVAELDRSIRHGVRSDGRSVVLMPSGMFQGLSDEDFVALLAYLRSLPQVDGEHGERMLGPMARFAFVAGIFRTERQAFDKYPEVAPAPADPAGHGKYLAVTTCTECHGEDLRGIRQGPQPLPPDLVVAAAYTPDNFIRLMREGVSQGGKELGLMRAVARGRFAFYSDAELLAIHAYLRSPEFIASGNGETQSR